MVCHGCYDAPCQLKLDAWAGLQRGASKEIVYDGTRLIAARPTRLFEDAQTVEQWRRMGFYPVLNDAAPEQGVMARMLALKQQHPLPNGDTLAGDDHPGPGPRTTVHQARDLRHVRREPSPVGHALWIAGAAARGASPR